MPIGIGLFPIGNPAILIGNKPIPIGNPVKKNSNYFHSKKENQFVTVLEYKRQTECIKVQSEDTVIQQTTEIKQISHPADECLAKGSTLETDHHADKCLAKDSTL